MINQETNVRLNVYLDISTNAANFVKIDLVSKSDQ